MLREKVNTAINWNKMKVILMLCFFLSLTACATNSQQNNKENLIAAKYNVQLGLGYLQEKDNVRAKQKLLLALKQMPDSPVVLDAMAYFLEKTGEPQQAEIFYQKALAISPNSGAALNNYGTFLCRQKNYSQAIPYFIKAARKIRYLNNAEAYENAGLCTLPTKDYNKAAEYFKKALLQDRTRLTALWELAQIQIKQKQYVQAFDNINRYNKLAPSMQSLKLGLKLAKNLHKQEEVKKYNLLLLQASTKL